MSCCRWRLAAQCSASCTAPHTTPCQNTPATNLTMLMYNAPQRTWWSWARSEAKVKHDAFPWWSSSYQTKRSGLVASYLSPSRTSSPSPRWNASGTRRVWSWEPVLPVAGCGRWFGPDTNRAAHSAAPTAPPSGLERRADSRLTEENLHTTLQ